MSLLLAIETATDICAVAVLDKSGVLVTLTLDRPRRHAERLVPMIDEACALSGHRPDEITTVAVSAGPGSYTGLRIGAATAKGLVFSSGAGLVPVPSLAALAGSVAAAPGTLILAAFGARRREVYWACYRSNGSALPDEMRKPEPSDALSVFESIGDPGTGSLLLVGDGASRLVQTGRDLGFHIDCRPWIRPSAAAVGRTAAELLQKGGTVDADGFEPYYLREFNALVARRSVFDRLPF